MLQRASITLPLAMILQIAAVSLAGPAAAALPPGVEAVTSVEGIDEFRLANGLRVLLFPDPSKQTVTVNITYLVGSRHEGYGETGMAHLLEHMVFKGSKGHTNIPDELTAHGSRPNGSTWWDRTNYFETFAATEENIDWALDLEADRMVNSFIAKKDLDSEMTVVRNEFEMGENDPRGVLEERLLSTAFLWHNYGKSTIGARSDIENVPIERLQAFYRTWYRPENAILVVAGKFEPEKTLALVQRKFGPIQNPATPVPATYTIEPAQDGEREVTLRRVGDVQHAMLCYHVPSGSHPDFAAVEVLSFLLGDSPSGRLYKGLVETKMATSVSSWSYQMRDPTVLLAGAEVPEGEPLEPVREKMVEIVEGFVKQPPTAEEVERARARLVNDWERSMRGSERAAIGLSEWAAMGDWRLIFLYRDRLAEVGPEDVERVASLYLKRNNRTAALYIPTEAPERVEVASTPDLAKMLSGYKGGTGMVRGAEFDVAPEAIEKLIVREVLPNGAKLALLPKKTRGGAVHVALNLHLGDQKSLENRRTVGDLTAAMLMRGTKQKTRQEILDAIDRLEGRLDIFGGATGVLGRAEVPAENLAGLLELMTEILREPSFPSNELEILKREQIAELEDAKSNPFSLAYTAFYRHMNPYPPSDVRYTATPEEGIAGIQATALEEVRGFHADFYGAGAAELTVVGDIDAQQVKTIAAKLLGDWKAAKPFTRIASEWRSREAIDQMIEAPDKENAVLVGGVSFPLRDDDPSYPALVLANFMTGGGFLNSRLATRIRQKEGLSYGTGSRFNASAWDKLAWFSGQAIYAPQNAAKLEAAFREEIEKVVKDGFTAEEVAEAKSGWLQGRQVSRSQERELLGTLQDRMFEGRTLAWDAELEAKIAALTPEQIHQAVRAHIDPRKMSIVQAGDYAKARQQAAGSGGPGQGSVKP